MISISFFTAHGLLCGDRKAEEVLLVLVICETDGKQCLFSLFFMSDNGFIWKLYKFELQVCSLKETGRCGNKLMNEWMNEKWTVVQVKCKTEFVLTLKQARGLWGCLGNWLPVQWMGKWAWSQQGFVGRWERRQAIGTQHMPHGGLMLTIWQRCWPSSFCWESRRVTTAHTPAFVVCRSWTADSGYENMTVGEHLVGDDLSFIQMEWVEDHVQHQAVCHELRVVNCLTVSADRLIS